MFIKYLISVAFIGTIAAGSALIATKCTASDSKCIKESAAAVIPVFAAGIPEYGIEPLDPLYYNKIDASTNSLKLIVSNITVTGLSKCKAKKIVRDVSKSKMYVRLQCDFYAKGKYEMKGKLLILDINGYDDFILDMADLEIAADLDMGEKVGSDDKNHWNITGYTYSYVIPKKVHLVFKNLLQESEILSRTANQLVADNAHEIIEEFGPPIIKKLADDIISRVNTLFSFLPIDEIEKH